MADNLRKRAEELLGKNPLEVPVLSTAQVQKLVHELDVHQVELQMQNEELRQAQTELSHSRDAYAELYDFAPVGYLTLDAESRILEANLTAAAMLGLERGRLLVGRTFAGFVHPDSLPAWEHHRQQIQEHPVKHGTDLVLQRADGTLFTAHVECAPRLDAEHRLERSFVTLADISKRVEAEATAAKAADRWKSTFDAMADAVFILDENQNVQLANKAASLLFGGSAEAMQGRPCWEIVHATKGPVKECPVQRMFQSGRRESMELAVDDSCFQVTADPLKNSDGEPVGAVHIVRDITSSKQIEQALRESEQRLALLNLDLEKRVEERSASLRESEERFRMLFEEAPDACFLIGLDGRFIDGNKAVERRTGYRCDELVGQSVYEFGIFPPSVRETLSRRIKQLGRGESMEPIEYGLKRKDGSDLAVEVTSMIIQLQGVDTILSSARDLTARRQAEKQLAESEERFHELFEHMASGVAVYEAKDDGADFVFKDINAAGQQLSKIKKEDAVGRSVSDLFPGIKEMGLFDVFQRVWRTGQTEQHPSTLYQDNRIHQWLENHVYKLPSGDVVAVYDDRTAQMQAEQEMKASEEKYRMLFESETDAILIFDGETRRFVDVNMAAERLYGYSREEFLQLTHGAITADPEMAEKTIPPTLAGQRLPSFTSRHRKKDGSVFPVEITGCSFLLKERPVICGVVRDVTMRVAREEELERNREELRHLASELSLAEQRERQRIATELHDGISQMLSSSYLRLGMLKESPLPEAAVGALDVVCGILEETLRQTRSLTFELSCPMLTELGLAAALQELCASMTREYSILFEFRGDAQPLPLHFDRQVVLYRSARELLINVMKHSGAKWAGVELERTDDHVRICVADDGVGFDAAMAGKGFSPSGGFGLFNIREYLHHAGGTLEIESVPGDGTQVVMMVPLEKDDG